MTENDPRVELKKLVINQKKVFLPPEPPDPVLKDLHEAVEQYDQLVSAGVISALQGQVLVLPLEELRLAQDRVIRLLDAPEIQASRKAEFYRSYHARLERMLALIKEIEHP